MTATPTLGHALVCRPSDVLLCPVEQDADVLAPLLLVRGKENGPLCDTALYCKVKPSLEDQLVWSTCTFFCESLCYVWACSRYLLKGRHCGR